MSNVIRIPISTGELIVFSPPGPIPFVEEEWIETAVHPGIGLTEQGARVQSLTMTLNRLWKKHRAGESGGEN